MKIRTLLISVFILIYTPIPLPAAEPVERIAAVVNGQIIFLSDIARDKTFFDPSEKDPNARLQDLIDNRLLRAEARRFVPQGPSEKEIDRKLKSIRDRFKSDPAFQEAMRRTGISLEELKKEIAENLWVEKLLQERISLFIFVTPQEIEKYYQEHAEAFEGKKPEEVEPQIRDLLTDQKGESKKKEYIARLRDRAAIEINLR
ncbi:MAG TPA: hypothetical protein VI382_00995 [Candidatus Manganitrophaceae bacterium]|nr:hypothetical protein [Candidatus Manganitrophaceae bacterium]